MWDLHRRIGGNVPGTFGDLQRQGHIEILTCAATHGYLPLLSRDESIHLQLRTAVETHKRHFGVAPRGIWLPECAYRPRYEWTAPTGHEHGQSRKMRPGIEEMLATHGIEYFVADSHLIAAAAPVFLYRDYVPRSATVPVSATPKSGRHGARRITRIASPLVAAPAMPSRSSAIPGRPFRCGAASTAIPATTPISNSTRSITRAGFASGASRTIPAISAPSSRTTRPRPRA